MPKDNRVGKNERILVELSRRMIREGFICI